MASPLEICELVEQLIWPLLDFHLFDSFKENVRNLMTASKKR